MDRKAPKFPFNVGDLVTSGTDPTPYEVAHFRWTIHGWRVGIYDSPPTGHVTYVDPRFVAIHSAM